MLRLPRQIVVEDLEVLVRLVNPTIATTFTANENRAAFDVKFDRRAHSHRTQPHFGDRTNDLSLRESPVFFAQRFECFADFAFLGIGQLPLLRLPRKVVVEDLEVLVRLVDPTIAAPFTANENCATFDVKFDRRAHSHRTQSHFGDRTNDLCFRESPVGVTQGLHRFADFFLFRFR